MDNINTLSSKALDNYFQTITHLNLVTFKDQSRLLVLIFIEELINKYLDHLNKEEKSLIFKTLNCLAKDNCLIDYMDISNEDDMFHLPDIKMKHRITEINDMRVSEGEIIRKEA